MRRPVIAGVAGGVGTSSIAVAIDADDLGVYRPGHVDVVVCRSTADSVELAHRVVNDADSRPVLVVVADGPQRAPAVVKSLLVMVKPHVAAVVRVPYVASWRQERSPRDQAAAALKSSGHRFLGGFRQAMEQLLDALEPRLGGPDGAPTMTRATRREPRRQHSEERWSTPITDPRSGSWSDEGWPDDDRAPRPDPSDDHVRRWVVPPSAADDRRPADDNPVRYARRDGGPFRGAWDDSSTDGARHPGDSDVWGEDQDGWPPRDPTRAPGPDGPRRTPPARWEEAPSDGRQYAMDRDPRWRTCPDDPDVTQLVPPHHTERNSQSW